MAAVRRALTINPRRTDAASFLGAMLSQRGQYDEALPYLESAVANGDRNAMTFALLSLVYGQKQRVDDAVRTAQQAAALGSPDEQVYLTIGRAMLPIGRLVEADAYLTLASRAALFVPVVFSRLGVVFV